MAKITYDNKEIYTDGSTNSQYFRFQDANEIKSVVNANDTRLEHLYELLSQETTQTGTEITIDNTFADNMQLDLKGNTSQNGDSPNPEFPQQVKVVTGNNNIKIVGKNLFNKNNIGVSSSTTITSIETGIRAVCTSTNRFCYGNFVIGGEELQGKTLTLTCNMSASAGNSCRALFYGLNSNKGLVAGATFGDILNSSGSITTTIPSTFPANVKYVALLLYSNADSTNAQVGDYCDYTNVQVEKSSTATTYEDYQEQTYEIDLGNIELCKIEDYQDYFFKENDKWYKHEVIEKIILNGSQGNWVKGSASGETYSVFQASWGLNKYVRNTTEILSDKIIGGDNSSTLTGEYIQTGGQASSPLRISILNSRLSKATSNGFNTFLANNNFTCYIPLATPTEIEITDTTLKEQLNNILTAQSYDYQTNITQTNAVLPFIITATARVERS